MRVLVTGHMGFVGKNLTEKLDERGIDWFGVDKKCFTDLRWERVVEECIQYDPTVIVHLASSCSTSGSIADPNQTFLDTVVTAGNITRVASVLHVPLLVTSSVKARDGMTPYGAAKQMVEIWTQECSRTYDFPVVINRPGTIYGPGQEGSPESGWIAWFLKAKESGSQVIINGDGLQVRDLLHVSDYVELLISQVRRPQFYADYNRIFDVGGGSDNVVTVIDMVNYLGLDYVYGPSRYGDARHYVGHNDVPGWEPRVFWKESEIFAG